MSFSPPVSAQANPADQTTKKEAEATAARDPALPELNACGCYEDGAGQCHCVKKSKCGCPGACEPAGCDDKRNKELEKEAQAELKRQQEEEKKRNAELAKKRDEAAKKEAQKREKSLRGLRLVE